MAKKRMGRPPKNPATPPGQRSNKVVGIRLKTDIAERLAAFVERYKAKHLVGGEKNEHVMKAIVEYLDREEPLLD